MKLDPGQGINYPHQFQACLRKWDERGVYAPTRKKLQTILGFLIPLLRSEFRCVASHFVRTLHSAFRSSWIEVEVELASSRFNCFGFWFLVFVFFASHFRILQSIQCRSAHSQMCSVKCEVSHHSYRHLITFKSTSLSFFPHPHPRQIIYRYIHRLCLSIHMHIYD